MKKIILLGLSSLIFSIAGCAQKIINTTANTNDNYVYAVALKSYLKDGFYPKVIVITSTELSRGIPILKATDEERAKNTKWGFVFNYLPKNMPQSTQKIETKDIIKENDIKYYEKSFSFLFSPILYSPDKTKAFLCYSQYSNHLLSMDHFIFLEKKNEMWSVVDMTSGMYN